MKEFDERWKGEVNSVRAMVLGQLDAEKPQCPECKKSVFTVSHKTGACTGTKETYACKNCGRHFVHDNDSYPNLYAKFMATMIVLTQGEQGVPKAINTLKMYSTDLETAPITRFLQLKQYEQKSQRPSSSPSSSSFSAENLRDAMAGVGANGEEQLVRNS